MGWLTGWNYHKSHVINAASGAGSNYQIKITVHYGAGVDADDDVYCNSLCRTDFGDIRFTDDDGVTLLDYWMETKTDSDKATFWVEVQDNLSTDPQTIYIYYGNAAQTTTSNGPNTFLQFDDFEAYAVGQNLDGVGIWSSDTTSPWTAQNCPGGRSGKCGFWDSPSSSDNFMCTVLLAQAQDGVAYGFHHYRDTNLLRNGYYQLYEGAARRATARDESGAVTYWNGAAYVAFNPALAWATDTWFKTEVRCVKTPAQDFDIVENGSIYDGNTQSAITTGLDRLGLIGQTGYAPDIYLDDFYVRKYRDPEPAHGAWGTETAETAQDLKCSFNVRRSDSQNLKAQFTARQSGGSDLFSKLIVKQSSSASLFSDFVVRQASYQDLKAQFTAAIATSQDLKSILWVAPSTFLSTRMYRKGVMINPSTAAQTNYVIPLLVHYGAGSDSGNEVYLNSKCTRTFQDVIFTSKDGTTLLDFFQPSESIVAGDGSLFFVEIDSIPAGTGAPIYIYYGGLSKAITESDVNATFTFGDDFDNEYIDPAKWDMATHGSGGSYVEQTDELALHSSDNETGSATAQSKTGFTKGICIEFRARASQENYYGVVLGKGNQIGESCGGTNWWHTFLEQGYICCVQDNIDFQYRFAHCPGGVDVSESGIDGPNSGSYYYFRIIYKANGDFQWFWSADGINWTQLGSGYNETTYLDDIKYVMFYRGGWSGGARGGWLGISYIGVRTYVDPEPLPLHWSEEERNSAPFEDLWFEFAARQAASADLFSTTIARHASSNDLRCVFSVRQPGSADVKAAFTVRQSSSADLKTIFGISQWNDIPAEFAVRQPATVDLKAELVIRKESSIDLKTLFYSRQASSQDLLAKLVVRNLSSTDLKSELIIRQETSRDLDAEFRVRHSATCDLKATFMVRQSASEDLKTVFEVHYLLGWAELKAEFLIRQVATADLKALLAVRQPGYVELKGLFVSKKSSTIDLKSTFVVRKAAASDLLVAFVSRNMASSDLLAILSVRHAGGLDLLAEFIIRRSAASDLLSEFISRNAGSSDLLSALRARHSAEIDLFSKFAVRHSSSENLRSILMVRVAASSDLRATLIIRQETFIDLKAILIVRHSSSAEFKAVFGISQFEDLEAKLVVRQASYVQIKCIFTARHSASMDLPCDFGVSVFEDLYCRFYVRPTEFMAGLMTIGGADREIILRGLDRELLLGGLDRTFEIGGTDRDMKMKGKERRMSVK